MIVASVALLVVAFWTLHYTIRALRPRPSVSLLLFSGLLFVHVVPMFIYLHFTGPDTLIYEAALAPVDAPATKARVLWALAFMFMALGAGARCAGLVAPRSWRRGWRVASRRTTRQVTRIFRAPASLRLALWLIALGMFAVILVENQPSKIINYFLSGESELEKTLLRNDEGGTGFYLYNVFLYSIAPFIVMVLWCMHRASPSDRELQALFVCFFLLVMVGKLGTLSKAPPVIFFLQFTLLHFLIQDKVLSWRSVTILLLTTVALLVLIVKLSIPDIGLLEPVFRFLYYRIFDIPNEGLVEYFSAFPTSLPHGWEYGVFGPLVRPANVAVLPNYSAVAEITRSSLLSTSNVMFVGDAWADYAWPGVVVTSFTAGLLVRMVDFYSLRNGFTHEWACLLVGCAFSVFTMLSTAFSTALVTGGLLLIPFVSSLFVRRVAGTSGKQALVSPELT